jgi:hypothetical protein
MKHLRTLPLAAALFAVAALPALPSHSAGILQPGAFMASGGAGCTMNFVYDGLGAQAGKVFIGTAAHCVTAVGDDVEDFDGEVWGDVAYIGSADTTADDFALIQVRSGDLGRISPAVKGYPSYPTGYTVTGEAVLGDWIQLSGYGIGYDLTPTTREKRQAVWTYDDAEVWNVIGPLINGDSGGPLIHQATGKALGIESRVCINICTDEGPTVQGILAKAAAAGFPVRLRTV